MESGKSFYEKVSAFCKGNNTSVSIIGIEGNELNMDNLAKCAEVTSGTVNILHPLELVRQIRLISQNPVVATNVELSVILHPDVAFSRQDSPLGLSRIVKELANVTQDADLSFEYEIRPCGIVKEQEKEKDKGKKEDKKGKGKDTSSSAALVSFPFQVQVKFTKTDGSQWLRVSSASRRINRDRAQCEAACNVALVGMAALQHAAILAGEYEILSARLKLRTAQRMFQRCATTPVQQEEFSNFLVQSEILDNELSVAYKDRTKGVKKLNDAAAKVVFQSKVIGRNLFLAGTRKDDVKNRKGNAAMNKQYYALVF